MKAVELLDSLCYVNNEYLISAERFREGKRKKVRFTRKKVILLAAAVVAALLLVGCAVAVVASLQNKKFGERTGKQYFDEEGNRITPTEVTLDIIAVNGTKDTPQYNAVKEWHEWNENYEPDWSSLSCDNDLGIPDNLYYTYNCFTWEMADKLTEILEKYGLKPLDMPYTVTPEDMELFMDTFSIPGLCHEDRESQFWYLSGIVYGVGAWEIPVDVTLKDGEEYQTTFTYLPKDYFLYDVASVKMESYEEWSYTTFDGSPVWIAMGSNGGIIFREREDAFLTVSFYTPNAFDLGQKVNPVTREKVEELADLCDFTVSPTVPESLDEFRKGLRESEDRWNAQNQEQINSEREKHNYESFAEYLTKNYTQPCATNYYTMWDLDGDGVEELLIGTSKGVFFDEVSLRETSEGSPDPFRLCENGVRMIEFNSRSRHSYAFRSHTVENGIRQIMDEICYRMDENQWYRVTDTATQQMTPISREEAEAVLAKYPPLEVPLMPLMDYPIDGEGTTLGEHIMKNWTVTTEENALEIYRQFLKNDSEFPEKPISHYRLKDTDGDGISELFAGWDADHFIGVYKAENGRIQNLVFLQASQLCEGEFYREESRNIFLDSYSIWKIEDGKRVQVDLIEYEAESGKWFRSNDGDYGYDAILTDDEAQAVLNSYKPIYGYMKPISEFPAK